MQLSEAMELGFAIVKFDPGEWLTNDGSCGCAFGGALVAAGIGNAFIAEKKAITCAIERGESLAFLQNDPDSRALEMECVRQAWPWLTAEHLSAISRMAFDVADKKKTKEDILAYVRSVEPPLPTCSVCERETDRLYDLEGQCTPEANLCGNCVDEQRLAAASMLPEYERNGR